MSAELTDIANELQKGARLFKAFEHGVEIAEKLKSLAQTEKEIKQSFEKHSAELEKLKLSVVESKKALAASKDKSEKVLAAAQENANKVEKDAQEKADLIIEKAQGEVDEVLTRKAELLDEINTLEETKQDADKLSAEANSKLEEIRSHLQSI